MYLYLYVYSYFHILIIYPISTLVPESCTVESWPDDLDQGDSSYASIDDQIFQGRTYQIGISGVSSVRIIGNGCKIQFKDRGGNEQCVLGAGDHYFATFSPACGNDRVTQYTVIQGPQGTLFI